MEKNKILISTAWWPNKTKYFDKYSNGVSELLKTKYDVELFITTKFHDSKYGSNFLAIKQCVDWALIYGFSHILILDADIVLNKNDFIKMINANKEILLVGRGSGEGLKRLPDTNDLSRIGWGCSLIKTTVFNRVSMEYTGDFLTPDRMWIKKARLNGYTIWCDFDIIPAILEKSSEFPMLAYQGDKNE
jgi:hypothetical protein